MCSRYRGVKEVFEYINVCVSVCEYSFQFSFVDFSASFPLAVQNYDKILKSGLQK